jgi:CSLREA domain-containing protein
VLFGELLGRRRGGRPALVLAVLASTFVIAPLARAEEFTVDSTADGSDAALGDEFCRTAGGECTLRAAIEESDALEESSKIVFDEETFEGQSSATIALNSSLPPITVQTTINGRTCETEAGLSGPCVGIQAQSGEPALTFEGATRSEIWGLAITGAQTAVSVNESTHFKAQGNWFGIDLDGTPGANGTGIVIGPGSDNGLIGSEGAERRNVIAASSDDGLDIHGASETRVLGNYFGVGPDGVTRAANGGNDIEVAALGGIEAMDTEIGTKVRSEGVVTPECDLGCNVISAAGANGIDLAGDDGGGAPAVATTIVGNFIGLDAPGAAALPNAATAVRVGRAAQTVIGGHQPGEANRINGGAAAVDAGPEAGDLVVYGNTIGVDSTGAETLAPPDQGIVVDSGSLSSAALEAAIVDNQIRMQGGPAIVQRGFGARIAGNEIFGAETGLHTFDSTEKHGNLIEGNVVEAISGAGMLIENNLNEVIGNSIAGAETGIWILGSAPFGVKENLIGGDASADENVIDGSGGDAIRITNVEKADNAVARNRGILNGGLFIDLVAVSPETEANGPNHGIQPPTFTTATQTGASGGDAQPGATVRVFGKQIAAAGELRSFLGQAIVDSEGSWSVVYSGQIPAGTIVAATQTSETGGTSELSMATTAGEVEAGGGENVGGGSSGSSNGGGGAEVRTSSPRDRIRPQTKIAKAPGRRLRRGIARFVFYSNEPGATFQCKLDTRRWRRCRSPKRYGHLRHGKHVFRVRAVDRAGNVDSSAPSKRFFVIGRHARGAAGK